ncbi:UPF0102 protein [Clostridium polyendosporum]|uniref:UPF0102 protein CPJCM30710_04870 n=1 Tax=Clostridium polyendosporum TaxID=69208 RepID=A0A919RY13_9CLOT|nr:YraN family protein [Clostridium polyendosporum]GIM27821.1 UPF0102 protein [Clostridium polyendosporum]
MKKYNKLIGSFGENIAKNYLINAGYNKLICNYYCKFGEIDFIGWDGEVLCFIEIKSRYSLLFGSPSEAVTYYKTQRIKKIAQLYLYKYKINTSNVRFDVLEVNLNYKNNDILINLIRDAFR